MIGVWESTVLPTNKYFEFENLIDQFDLGITVRKLQDFSFLQILREINFGAFRSCESAILCHFMGL